MQIPASTGVPWPEVLSVSGRRLPVPARAVSQSRQVTFAPTSRPLPSDPDSDYADARSSCGTYTNVFVPQLAVPAVAESGVDLSTLEEAPGPTLDVAAIEPQVVKQVERRSLRARQLKLQQVHALRWCDPHFTPESALAAIIRSFCDVDGCEFINGIPASLPAAQLKARRSVLSFYLALRSRSTRASATAFIQARAAAHRRWISARSRPAPVSPTPKRWCYVGSFVTSYNRLPPHLESCAKSRSETS
jgi:hypothetical protein